MNLRELKEIFRLVEKTDFNEVEIVQGDVRVRIERGKGTTFPTAPLYTPVVSHPVSHSPGPAPSASQRSEAGTEAPARAAPVVEKGQFVTSPFVGTFYRSPSPDASSYVELGQTVKKGQVLCIVEAMKLMNEIESDYDGKIGEIFAENAQPVEFGEKLFRIDPL